MNAQKSTQVEQVSLQYFVENAVNNFAKTTLSTRTKVLLIGGYVDKTTATKAYLSRTRPGIDRRRKLELEDEAYVSSVEMYASDADNYINWARSEGGQPIWREALVSYCSSFESCLKAIAIAFLLSERQVEPGLSAQVIIPGEDLTGPRRTISKQWYEAVGDMPKVRQFFESAISSKKVASHYLMQNHDISERDWEVCSAAFQVRNAVVHNLGYMHQSVRLGSLDLFASWQIELNQQAISDVSKAFFRILEPFDPYSLGI